MYISQHLACAMVNCDYSALDGNEIELIKDFHIVDLDSGISFTRCHITGLYNDCVEVEMAKRRDIVAE